MNAWASVHLLGQPNSVLARSQRRELLALVIKRTNRQKVSHLSQLHRYSISRRPTYVCRVQF
jgi:hypothetical protein